MMVMTGNKYENTMYEWYEILAKAEKRLADSIECNKLYGDNEDWIEEDTAKVEKINRQISDVKASLESRNVFVDYEKIKASVRI
jgi:hypothetical protein